MMKYIKSYRAFLSTGWMRLLLYLVYPIVVIGWAGFMAFVSNKFAIIGLGLAAELIIFAELFLDSYVYGGILSKDTNKLEYLKTSYMGMSVLKKSLIVDKVRRLITTSVILGVIYMISHEGVNAGQFAGVIFATALTTELALLVARQLSNVSWVLVVALGANLLVVAVLIAVLLLPAAGVVVFIAIYLGVTKVSNQEIMKKVEGSYYDVEVGKMH